MKNLKTSLSGILAGGLIIGLEMFQKGETDIKTILTAVGIAVIGMFAKDFNQTHTKK